MEAAILILIDLIAVTTIVGLIIRQELRCRAKERAVSRLSSLVEARPDPEQFETPTGPTTLH